MKKKIPLLKTDKAAEDFLKRDLSDLDFGQFKLVRFEFAPKTARVNMRLPEELLKAVKSTAARRGMPYQRLIREALEDAVTRRTGRNS